jgi:uncharacterized cupin superfamily protein
VGDRLEPSKSICHTPRPARHNELVGYRVLHAADAFWRPSNQMGVPNTDLARQLSSEHLGARLWRLAPGQASTRHRHVAQHELYVVLEGTGRIRVDGELLTLAPLSALSVEPGSLRQIFNDTDADALWLAVGTPPEQGNTLEMTPELLAHLYPDGPRALPPELSGAPSAGRGSDAPPAGGDPDAPPAADR